MSAPVFIAVLVVGCPIAYLIGRGVTLAEVAAFVALSVAAVGMGVLLDVVPLPSGVRQVVAPSEHGERVARYTQDFHDGFEQGRLDGAKP